MKRICSVAQIREAERKAKENGTDDIELMKRAGKGIISFLPEKGSLLICCGKGNNGGDGYAVASLLAEKRKDITLLSVEKPSTLPARHYYEQCLEKGIICIDSYQNIDFNSFDIILDCLFGIGFRGEIPPLYADCIQKINNADAYVLSADIPSGLNGDNGLGEIAVRCDKCIVIGQLKYGNRLNRALDFYKEEEIVDIGFEPVGAKLLEREDFFSFLQPRQRCVHKGLFGYVALYGGSENYSGAIKLANFACSGLYAGAGVVRLAVPEDIFPYVAPHLFESTLYREKDTENILKGVSSIGVGCGWGRQKERENVLRSVFREGKSPLIIDADGLYTLKNIGFEHIKKYPFPVILTPHYAEMARLCGVGVREVESSSLSLAESFAKEQGVTVVLKGPVTIITNGEQTYLTSSGCGGMATAGSGDVLLGIMTAIVGQFKDNIPLSVAFATYLNGIAGELAQKECTDIGMTSLDTAKKIQSAVYFLRKMAGIS